MLPFFVAKNLADKHLREGAPWEFSVDEMQNTLRKLEKSKRRAYILRPTTNWNIYNANRGLSPTERISKTNPPVGGRGLVADYDMVSNIDTVMGFISQQPETQQPNFVERSLSDKIRLVWGFEREIMLPNYEFANALISKFHETLGLPTLLAGYDPSSVKPSEMWTNGGIWYDVRPEPLSWKFCFGVLCDVSKHSSLFSNGEIPFASVVAEVAKRWPGRWDGEFVVGSIGVRFWDEKADCATGCQVKPDGLLCFTGKEPFVKWETLFGRAWCEEQRVLSLGNAASDIYFDGKNYWEERQDRWKSSIRTDIILRLKGRGLSDKCPKGATQSDVERVLDHIQVANNVDGAAPLINYPTGIVNLQGRTILNTADLMPVKPVAGTGIPEKDFPWIWGYLNGFFPRPELLPLDHFLAWLRRAYRVVLEHKRFMGQAVFICGPRNNGKTLLCLRIVAPLMGGRVANPIDYMIGDTDFNSELFHSALLAVNDEDAPGSEAARRRMLAKLKGLVVNPVHKYHAKFEKPVTIDWTGRIFVTLNDDAGSVGMLLEVEQNTRDKQMYFASQPYNGVFPSQDILEAIIERELPLFAHFLLNIYAPPPEVLTDDRMGVVSYFDPKILELSHQQTFAANLVELIKVWQTSDAYWDGKEESWEGSPTQLLSCLQTCVDSQGIARDWSQPKVVRALTSLAKQDGSGIVFVAGDSRSFKINRL